MPAWLCRHLKGCKADIDAVQEMSPAKGRHGEQPLTISRAAFHGFATVKDPDEFANTLMTGVGRGKRFGAGLVLARRSS
ncbi:hypothetical protein AB656_04055 [Bifidobacterium actinocoloniiforme DSM 22766]|nr:hypothetical protein AB656_04055 [Bifidobacterium actinocoloniiforme DSM 22766]